MGIYTFSTLVNGQHVPFDFTLDWLRFDSISITASAVRLSSASGSLGFTAAGKTVWLDGVAGSGLLALENVEFANGSVLIFGDGTNGIVHDAYGAHYTLQSSTVGNQVWGLGGADIVEAGSSADWIVGNVALAPLNHVSRVGSTGSPTSSTSASVSADGRFVAFAGGWTQFGSTNNNGTDVFVKDLTTGVVSDEHRSAAGINGGSGSGSPIITANGEYLVFLSSSALVSGTPPSGSLYISSVATNEIELISTASDGTTYANRAVSLPDVSATGRYVVFSSTATNLAVNSTSTYQDVFLKDLQTGSVTRISTSLTGGDGNGDSGYAGNAARTGAKISADGDYVVFQSNATNLTSGDTNGRTDIFLWTASNGQLTNLTQSLPALANAGDDNIKPDVAYNGDNNAIVLFQTGRSLVAEDTNAQSDIYALNFITGALQLVSSKANGSGVALSSEDASISDDGRWAVFSSNANDLVANDINGARDIFVKDLFTGQIALVSRSASGTSANGPSGNAQISSGGDWIVFESSASNLAATDGNIGLSDVFRVANPLLKDTLIGGAGNDVYVINRADSIIEAVGGGTDTVQSSISYRLGANLENLTLTGTGNLNGIGNTLNNVITGTAGANALNGSSGTDTVSYANATVGVTVNLSLTTAQATGFGSDTLTAFENLTGSRFDDRLTGNPLGNRLDGGLGNDTLTGGEGSDTYVCDSPFDIIVETGTTVGDIDTVVASVSWTLGSTLENLTLTGTAAINGGGNIRDNVINGNAAANLLSGSSGNDKISGGAGNDTISGGAGNDLLSGGSGNDIFVLSNLVGSETIGDFATGIDDLRISQSSLKVGDGDLVVEGGIIRAAPGGFSSSAELVIFSGNIASLTPSAAAAAIGSATTAYAADRTALFAVDNGTSSGIYYFHSADGNALVSAPELTLLATLNGTASTALGDYLFGA